MRMLDGEKKIQTAVLSSLYCRSHSLVLQSVGFKPIWHVKEKMNPIPRQCKIIQTLSHI